jgi:ABC-type xylose transport system permease subunit
MRLTALFQRFVSAPEFGPLVLLGAEMLVFTVRSPAFLSASNISNLLAFTPELGMITLGMTLLMTAGEFDLSVGSVFGFAPIMMWTFYNTHAGSLELGFLFALVVAALVGFINGWMGWVPSAYLGCQLHADEPHRRTIFRRHTPDLRVTSLVHSVRGDPGLRADAF